MSEIYNKNKNVKTTSLIWFIIKLCKDRKHNTKCLENKNRVSVGIKIIKHLFEIQNV